MCAWSNDAVQREGHPACKQHHIKVYPESAMVVALQCGALVCSYSAWYNAYTPVLCAYVLPDYTETVLHDINLNSHVRMLAYQPVFKDFWKA